MPSYIELNKNNLPASSDVSKVVFGINTSGTPVLVDNNGNISVIKTSGFEIPTPIVSITGETQVFVQFPDTGLDFSSVNPELFLFRWRNNHVTKHNGVKRRRTSKWVHPTTSDAATKWAGWKFFGGNQYWVKGSPGSVTVGSITGRTTEWTIPPTLKPYEKVSINFNKYMFWNQFDTSNLTLEYDQNFFSGFTYTPTNHVNNDYVITLGGNRQSIGRNRYSNSVMFCFALGIDNPNATKTNGLCPKIFGSFSEPFYSILKDVGNSYNDVILVKDMKSRHKHIIKDNFY